MNKNEIESRIIDSIIKLEKKYPDLFFQHRYNVNEDEHWIMHNSFELETDDDFLDFIGKDFDANFHDKGIFNVFVSCEKSFFITSENIINYKNDFSNYETVKVTKYYDIITQRTMNVLIPEVINTNQYKNLAYNEEVKMNQNSNFALAA